LLVVIGIIAIRIAILMPALNNERGGADEDPQPGQVAAALVSPKNIPVPSAFAPVPPPRPRSGYARGASGKGAGGSVTGSCDAG
jgi:hypothetical protein